MIGLLVTFIDDIDSSHGDGISVVLDTDKGLHIEAAAECGWYHFEYFIDKSTLLRYLEVEGHDEKDLPQRRVHDGA